MHLQFTNDYIHLSSNYLRYRFAYNDKINYNNNNYTEARLVDNGY